MPRSETVISLFVASPSDVAHERQILHDVVTELNAAWSKNLALRFELVRWENLRPGVGTYAQEVINSQVGTDYDVLVAIFWARIGTATPSHISGTVEEIEGAFSRLRKGEELEIMIYFKDAPIPPSAMDPVQLTKLNELKQKLQQEGCLYSSFSDESSFESMIRGNLSAIAQKFSSNSRATAVSKIESIDENNANSIVENLTAVDSDDYGLLDYMDLFESKIDDFNGAMNSLAEATALMGERLSKRTEQLNTIAQKDGPPNRGQVRKVADLTSSDIDQYTYVVNTQVKVLREARIATFDALSRALSLQFEIQPNSQAPELHRLYNTIGDVINTTKGALESALEFQESMEDMPRMSVTLNRSKKNAIAATDAVCGEIAATIKASEEVQKVIVKFLDDNDLET